MAPERREIRAPQALRPCRGSPAVGRILLALAVFATAGAGCSCGGPVTPDAAFDGDVGTVPWVAVDALGRTACAVRADGLAMCWGQGWVDIQVLPTRLASIRSGGETRACGLDADGVIQCFFGDFGPGPFPVEWSPPAGRFEELALHLDAACALDAAGIATCWANDRPSPTNPVFPAPTSEPLVRVSLYSEACAVTAIGTGLCWTPFYEGPPQPPAVPAGAYSLIDMDGAGWCGLTTDGEVSCWSESAEWLAMMGTPPTGPFVELSVDFPTCALRPTGEAVCWGQRWLTGPTPGPLAAFQPADERYAHMTTGGGFFCGILLDGRLSCWGENGHGQTSPPMPE